MSANATSVTVTPVVTQTTVPTVPKSTTPALTQPTTTTPTIALPTEQIPPIATTPRQLDIDFDELRRVLEEKGPQKPKFLKSKRCKILVVIGVLLTTGVLALLATTYALAFTAETTTITITIINQTTTSTAPISTFQRLTQVNDATTALCNTTAGGTGYNAVPGTIICSYPSGQGSDASVDFTNTTYMNYGTVGLFGTPNTVAGVGTGLHTTLQIGLSIVQSIQFQTGNESANRDPLSITLEGTNRTGTQLYNGAAWTLLYTGVTGLLSLSSLRLTWGELQNFSNTNPFTSYRVLVTSQRGADVGTEYAEMHLYGIV